MKKYGESLIDTVLNQTGDLKKFEKVINDLNTEIKKAETLVDRDESCKVMVEVAVYAAKKAKETGKISRMEIAVNDLRAINEE